MFKEAMLGLFLVLPIAAQAGETRRSADLSLSPMVLTQGFMDAHPDLKYLNKGMHAYGEQRFDDAFRYFQRSAFYADKASQGMLAEMLWNGEGRAKDRAIAYIWMDLAAERGYELYVQQRERYWGLLDEAEKAKVATEGARIRSVYADSAAKRRIAILLRRARANITGSHAGATAGSALTIVIPGPAGGSTTIDGTTYFSPRYWDPDEYQAWQDEIWGKTRNPRADVGAIEQITTTVPAEAPKTRLPEAVPDMDAEAPSIPEDDRR